MVAGPAIANRQELGTQFRQQPLEPARSDRPAPRSGTREAVTHPLITTFFNHVHTRVATTLHELEAAAELVRRRYSWRGYDCAHIGGETDELTLMTSDRDKPAGTLTLRPDGEIGLQADVGFRRELDAARRQGHRLGEVTRLAVEAESDSKAVLASLFYVGQWIFRFHNGVTRVVIEVNPRHVVFYRRALGFALASGERTCERVGAPAVLLSAPIDVISQRAAAFRDRVLTSVAPAPV
jgi:hypothetical protein